MKKGVLFLAIISIAFTSCRKETTYTYIYENRSGYDILIEDYSWEIKYIDIPNEDEYIDIYIYVDIPKPGYPPFGSSTKVNIIFDNLKVLTWYNRFPYEGIFGNNYRQVKTGKYSYDMVFTFTSEMYDDALPIDEQEE